MPRHGVPKLDGLEDWELELLWEMRILKQAGVVDHVLDAIVSTLEVLYLESERREPRAKDASMRAPEFVSRLISERTTAGKLLKESGYKRADIQKELRREIAQKARQKGINACRAYISSTI